MSLLVAKRGGVGEDALMHGGDAHNIAHSI
jgi:hypothetical protein